VDGYDLTAATNMLSHFLIAKELFPELRRATEAKLANKGTYTTG
jgi:hypothetical protein